MTKQDLIEAVTFHTGQSDFATRETIDAIITVIRESLHDHDDITIRGLGTFKVVQRKPKMVRDINAKKSYMMESKWRVKFIPGKGLQNLK